MTGGRTTNSTSLSSRGCRKRTTGSSWEELSAAMLDLSSASRLFSMMRMSPILTGNMCSSKACTKAKNLSRYWSWMVKCVGKAIKEGDPLKLSYVTLDDHNAVGRLSSNLTRNSTTQVNACFQHEVLVNEAQIDDVSHLNYHESRRAEDFHCRTSKQQANFLDHESTADSTKCNLRW